MSTTSIWASSNACAKSHGTSRPTALSEGEVTGAATPTWYVSVEIRKSGILPRRRSPREIKTFATEAEAKIFARSKLDDGLAVFAGTINPHSSKRLVLSSQILAWLNDEPASNDPPRGSEE
jgi:hypothetical protein